jgi:hypothetical protein
MPIWWENERDFIFVNQTIYDEYLLHPALHKRKKVIRQKWSKIYKQTGKFHATKNT